jgi:hypothetical protein
MRPSRVISKVPPSLPVVVTFQLTSTLLFMWMRLGLSTIKNASAGLMGCRSFVCILVIIGTSCHAQIGEDAP